MKNDSLGQNNFDVLRLAAAVQVMVAHSSIHLKIDDPWWLKITGHFPGVPIFFVISGFLIASSYERSADNRQYFIKRALRIFPALWCCVVLTAITALIFGFEAEPIRYFTWLILQFFGIIYTPQFLQGFGFGSYNGSLWTIPVEIQFYIVLPALYFITARLKMGNKAFVGAFIVALTFALITRIYSPYFSFSPIRETVAEKLLRYSFIPHIYMFFLGVLVFRLKIHRSRFIQDKFAIWLFGYGLAAATLPVESGWYVLRSILLGLTVASAAFSFVNFSIRLLRGYDISYGVYIYHGLIVNIFIQLELGGADIYILAVMFLTALAGLVSWIFVERRCIRLKWKIGARRQLVE